MFSSKFITKKFYVKTIKKIDLSEIKIKEENKKCCEKTNKKSACKIRRFQRKNR